MKKYLYVVLDDLFTALQELGYHRVRPRSRTCHEWRRGPLHIIVCEATRGRFSLQLHYDVSFTTTGFSPYSPRHTVRQRGKDLKEEFHRIVQAYKSRRPG